MQAPLPMATESATAHSRLRSLGIDFPFMVAPMVGLTHVAFRELIRGYVPTGLTPLLFTEMLSTRRVPSERLESSRELKVAPGETGFIPQLLGNEERFIALSIKKLLKQNPWGFDINMGCPVKHTLRHNWGVRLLGDAAYAAEVVKMARRHSPLPVSVKMRGGADSEIDLDFLFAFTEAIEAAGADWITVHPRPRSERHRGRANWEAVGEVRKRRSLPVVANGDIQTADDALAVLADYQVDGIMIARAATARPWIIWQIAHKLGIEAAPPGREGQLPPQTLAEESREYFRALVRFLDLLTQYFSEDDYILQKYRFYVATSSKWFLFGHAFWKRCMKCKTPAELREMTVDYGERFEFPMSARIDL